MALKDFMLQQIENPVRKVNRSTGNQNNQFSELMDEINYAFPKVKSKKWNLAQYYNYMADFFDYIQLPEDAQEFRELAKKLEI